MVMYEGGRNIQLLALTIFIKTSTRVTRVQMPVTNMPDLMEITASIFSILNFL